jgi:hypothetical protein
MIRIEISPYDQKDLLELLDYASKMKENNRPILKGSLKWDDTKYWVMRIEQLKQIIKGKIVEDSVIKSSMLTMQTRNDANE